MGSFQDESVLVMCNIEMQSTPWSIYIFIMPCVIKLIIEDIEYSLKIQSLNDKSTEVLLDYNIGTSMLCIVTFQTYIENLQEKQEYRIQLGLHLEKKHLLSFALTRQ